MRILLYVQKAALHFIDGMIMFVLHNFLNLVLVGLPAYHLVSCLVQRPVRWISQVFQTR